MLAKIEDMRPLYVRGDVAGGLETANRALDLLSQIRTIALAGEAGR